MNTKNNPEKSPLHTYIEDQNLRKVYRGKVSHFGEVLWRAPSFLELAVDHIKCLKIYSQDNEDLTALYAEALYSKIHVSNLIDAGAYSKIWTNNGMNLLHLASSARRSDAFHFLI